MLPLIGYCTIESQACDRLLDLIRLHINPRLIRFKVKREQPVKIGELKQGFKMQGDTKSQATQHNIQRNGKKRGVKRSGRNGASRKIQQ